MDCIEPSIHCSIKSPSPSLLVQLVRPLLELLLAGRLAKVVGNDWTRVGLVVFEGGGTTAGGLVVGVVQRVGRSVGVAGLFGDLVGDA